MGIAPGPKFKDYIEEANLAIAKGESWEKIRARILADSKQEPVYLEMRNTPLNISLAVDPETEAEYENVAAAKNKIEELSRVPIVQYAALMPDTCPAGSEFGSIPVGGAIRTKSSILPAAHSADIACSMCASFFRSEQPMKELLNNLSASTLFGPFAQRPGYEISHPVLEEPVWENKFLKGLEGHALRYLGTQGDGNHFGYIGEIDVTDDLINQLDENGHEWHVKQLLPFKGGKVQSLITHHGSRNLGAQLYKRGMIEAIKETSKIAKNIPKSGVWLDTSTPIGQEYWEALQYIGRWTEANHEVIHDKFLTKSGTKLITRMKNDHNFVWEKNGTFYHGKGATPAWKDELGRKRIGIIPLNMGREILLVLGNDNEQFLSFAPHGAGRNQSRTATLRPYLDPNTNKPDAKKIEAAIAEATKGLDIRWGSGKPDISESPFGYKDPEKIIKQLEKFELAKLIGAFKPKGCIMAGEFPTPWKEKKLEKQRLKEIEALAHGADINP